MGHIGQELNIELNNSIINIDEIGNVKTVGGAISIRYNEMLSSIEGLSGVETVSGSLTVSGNNNLSECSIENLLKEIGAHVGGVTTVENYNATIICD